MRRARVRIQTLRQKAQPRSAMTSAQRAIKAATSKAKSDAIGAMFDFQCKAAKLPDVTPEYLFAVDSFERRWRFDRAFPGYKVAVEFEGGLFAGSAARRQAQQLMSSGYATVPAHLVKALLESGGRHNNAASMREDMIKYGRAAQLGWIVISVMPEMVQDGTALQFLEGAMKSRGWTATL